MVIQRIQSVLLLIATIAMGVFSFAQIANIQVINDYVSMTTLSLSSVAISSNGSDTILINTWFFFTLSILTGLIALIDIFLFKNLILQRRLCRINIILLIALYGVTFTIAYTAISGIVSWNYFILSMPLVAIIAIWLAYKRITSDENLLKSADRIR